MAKRLSGCDSESVVADSPLPFDPRRLHTRKETADGFRVVPRTVDRWDAQGLIAAAEINGRKRYLGDRLNRFYQSCLKK
jgi:hypothetical protein